MLVVENASLGDVQVNSRRVFKVKIHNVSDKTINIGEVFVGCQSCTTISMPKHKLYANEVMEASITFSPKTLGSVSRTVTIRWGETDTSQRSIISFTANVIR